MSAPDHLHFSASARASQRTQGFSALASSNSFDDLLVPRKTFGGSKLSQTKQLAFIPDDGPTSSSVGAPIFRKTSSRKRFQAISIGNVILSDAPLSGQEQVFSGRVEPADKSQYVTQTGPPHYRQFAICVISTQPTIRKRYTRALGNTVPHGFDKSVCPQNCHAQRSAVSRKRTVSINYSSREMVQVFVRNERHRWIDVRFVRNNTTSKKRLNNLFGIDFHPNLNAAVVPTTHQLRFDDPDVCQTLQLGTNVFDQFPVVGNTSEDETPLAFLRLNCPISPNVPEHPRHIRRPRIEVRHINYRRLSNTHDRRAPIHRTACNPKASGDSRAANAFVIALNCLCEFSRRISRYVPAQNCLRIR